MYTYRYVYIYLYIYVYIYIYADGKEGVPGGAQNKGGASIAAVAADSKGSSTRGKPLTASLTYADVC
jgi:hypothetical protein